MLFIFLKTSCLEPSLSQQSLSAFVIMMKLAFCHMFSAVCCALVMFYFQLSFMIKQM